ncbi:MAG TPA: M42 family metallopeptidase [Terriglobales bacterium]|nr:M42 family metallopeptidase [Terriglobales bacterium]
MKTFKCLAIFFCLAASVFAQDATVQLLQKLVNANGPSGFEEPVRKIMVKEMRPYADRISYDGLGSVIATQGRSGPRVMIDAHMDELGGVIRRVTPDGFLTMQMLGGWLDQALVDQRWTILGSKGEIRAVTGIRDAHIVPPEERTKVYPRDWIFLDVGAKNAAEVAAMGLAPGDPVAPDSPFAIMNGTNNYLAKAWDDRVGCAIMIRAMQKLAKAAHPNQIFYAATVQEEIGLRGARTSSEIIKPDVGIALEVGIARDVPKVNPEEAQERLGDGPGIFVYNGSELPNRKLYALVQDVARAQNIPLQPELVQGYGDDSAEIQKSNGGVPTILLSVPTRYTHAHNGIINRADIDRTTELLIALIQRLDQATVAQLRDFAP